MYLFILESIGTQELILIGMVALIVFGPRKLPDLARTIGKTMADFRKVTGEFKQTWEKEVEEDKKMFQTLGEDPILENNSIALPEQNSIAPTTKIEEKLLSAPTIKELSPEEVARIFNKDKTIEVEPAQTEEPKPETATLTKRDWL
ncbi:MAG TPA: twin-arginine translocase TatA/TatE family subunit [Pyrinomonadaceae bacterium]|nr:twin-arginine translocase TatA/TatE family subunit [Pyrinomonadaceae bacterium]